MSNDRKMGSFDVENAILNNLFDFRKYVVVPNVSWGFLNHEADLLAMTKAGVLHEIEIKISKADLKRDFVKGHNHKSKLIKFLWYAGPESLKEAFLEYVPEQCGIILVKRIEHPSATTWYDRAEILRKPKANPLCTAPLSIQSQFALARLGAMRYWCRREWVELIQKERAKLDNAFVAAVEAEVDNTKTTI